MRPGTHTAAPCPGRRRGEFHVTRGLIPPRAGRLPADRRYASGNRKTPGRRPECQDAGPAVVLFAIISSRRDGRPADPLYASRRRQGSAGRAGAACMGRRRGPALRHRSRRRDEGFSRESPASGGVHTPGGGGYAAKTGTPVRATMPGRAFHCGGREGENPPHRPPGNGWGETGGHGHAMQKNRAPPMAGEAPVRWRVAAGKVGNPLAAIVPARGNPAGGVHAPDCMRPGCPVGFSRRDEGWRSGLVFQCRVRTPASTAYGNGICYNSLMKSSDERYTHGRTSVYNLNSTSSGVRNTVAKSSPTGWTPT